MKKLLKIIKIITISIIGIIAAVFLYLYVDSKLFIGFKDNDNIDYLTKQHVPAGDSINGKLFDDAFYGSKVFLMGEIHGYADNQKLDKAMLLFLHKNAGVKYYIAEMDSTTANKFNAFLGSNPKNEAVLHEAVSDIRKRIPQQSSRELFEKWMAIHDYNSQQPDSLKITVIGIDKGFDDKDATITRDSAMMLNFAHAVAERHLENEKFYGFFGFFHVLQNTIAPGKHPFAEKLKAAGIRTTSFVSYTLDSDMYLPKNPQFPTPADEKVDWVNADGPLMLVKGIQDLKALTQPHSITLFRIDGAQSPYAKSQHLMKVKARMFGENFMPVEGAVTMDYFQYVFLLRNSGALTKLP